MVSIEYVYLVGNSSSSAPPGDNQINWILTAAPPVSGTTSVFHIILKISEGLHFTNDLTWLKETIYSVFVPSNKSDVGKLCADSVLGL